MSNSINLLTPVGRMVQGHPMEEQTKDHKGNPLVVKTGPNMGQPRVSYFFALAIPKNDPQWPGFKQQIDAIAQAGYPAGEWQQPTFRWKIIDGDSAIPNEAGHKPCEMIGFPGNWVLRISGGFAPKVYTRGAAALIANPAEIKRGDFVRAYISVKPNGQTGQQAGIYLNPSMVELIGYGEEIVTGPSGQEIFGSAPVANLPAGASATPTAPQTQISQPDPIQTGPNPMGGAPAPAAQQAAPPPVMQQQTVAPAPDFLNPDEKKKNYNGQIWTVGQLKASGWTQEQIDTLPDA